MFDFANSAYTTVIITVIFGPIFTNIIVPPSNTPNDQYAAGNTLWATALGISYILVVLSAPFFGAITDFSANKKRFLFASYIVCILATASLWFVASSDFYLLAFLLIIVSNFAFSSGENFISSFLPFLGRQKDLGKISGYAWGVGYFGGLLSIIIIKLLLGESEAENYDNLRLVGPITALFFLIAGIPTFLFLREPGIDIPVQKSISFFKSGYERLFDTLKNLKKFKDLSVFLVSMFFALASLYIVISFTFVYGKQVIGLDSHQEAIVFVLTQFSAAFGSVVFGLLQDRLGALKSFLLTITLWIFAALMLYFIQDVVLILNQKFHFNSSVQSFFMLLAVFAGIGLGGMQSASRTIIGLFSPPGRSGEFFGLWGCPVNWLPHLVYLLSPGYRIYLD